MIYRQNNSNKLIISHIADIDGMGGVILAKIIDPNIDYILTEINELGKVIEILVTENIYEQYENIYIVDLPLRGDLIEKINSNTQLSKKIVHFDHHDSDFTSSQYPWSTVIHNRGEHLLCGTKLFFEYLIANGFSGNPLIIQPYTEDLVEQIRSYDTWDWKKTNNTTAGGLTYLFIRLGEERFINHYYHKIVAAYKQNDTIKVTFDETEQMIIDSLIDEIQRHIKKCDKNLTRIKIGDYNVGLIITELYRSDVGNALSIKYKDELDFIMIYDFMRRSISLRTVTDVNVGQFAKQYGGGGIAKAAGLPINGAELTIITSTNDQIQVSIPNKEDKIDFQKVKK